MTKPRKLIIKLIIVLLSVFISKGIESSGIVTPSLFYTIGFLTMFSCGLIDKIK